MSGADLRGANLTHSIMKEINLRRANLSNANLDGSNLHGADLYNATIDEAWLFHTNMSEADLRGADLRGARLLGTKLNSAKLGDAKLRGAKLDKAILNGADIRNADFSNARVTGIKYNNLKSCRGVRSESCYGDALFRRHVMDEDYIETFKERHKFSWLIWSISSNCGRSLTLWGLWSLGLALAFAFIYWNWFQGSFHVPADTSQTCPFHVPADTNPIKELGFNFWTMTYYSIVTFTTLGFGDITPKTTGAMIAVTIEVIVGYIMLGGLISIFANKLARRA